MDPEQRLSGEQKGLKIPFRDFRIGLYWRTPLGSMERAKNLGLVGLGSNHSLPSQHAGSHIPLPSMVAVERLPLPVPPGRPAEAGACHPVGSDPSAVAAPETAPSAPWQEQLQEMLSGTPTLTLLVLSLVGGGNPDSHIPCGSHAIWLADRNPCCLPGF